MDIGIITKTATTKQKNINQEGSFQINLRLLGLELKKMDG